MKNIRKILILTVSFLLLSASFVTASVKREYQETRQDSLAIRYHTSQYRDSFAQIFEPGIKGLATDFYATSIDINFAITGGGSHPTSGNLYVELRNTTGNVPVGGIGNYLSQNSIPCTSISTGPYWVTFTLATPVLFHVGTRYALTLWSDTTDGNSNHWIGWSAEANDNAYDGSTDCVYKCTSSSLSGWSKYYSYDAEFRIYGEALPYINHPPAITYPSPEDDSANISLMPICHVNVSDADGNASTVNFYSSYNGGDWVLRQTNNSVLNETIFWNYLQANTSGTLYYWKVTAQDTYGDITTEIYDFTTVPLVYPRWDINQDGTVNYLDVSLLVSHYGEDGLFGWIPEDINSDGFVNYLDVSSLVSHYGESY